MYKQEPAQRKFWNDANLGSAGISSRVLRISFKISCYTMVDDSRDYFKIFIYFLNSMNALLY